MLCIKYIAKENILKIDRIVLGTIQHSIAASWFTVEHI